MHLWYDSFRSSKKTYFAVNKIMYIRLASDLHNEFAPWQIPELDTDKDTVLVLAGDIDMRARSADWMAKVAPRFKAIVMVLGNHDYWKDSLDTAPKRLKNRIAELGLSNVYVLDREAVVIDDDVLPVRFIGATLWTDFMNADPFAMFDAVQTMKDYKKIRNQGGRTNLHTKAILDRHLGDKTFIKQTLAEPFEGHSVVVTHHAPSPQSTDDKYKTPEQKYSNAAYHSNLEEWARPLVFTYWFHGHTHTNFVYPFGAVGTVMCNPRGYASIELNDDFDPTLRLDMTQPVPRFSQSSIANGANSDYASWWQNMGDTP